MAWYDRFRPTNILRGIGRAITGAGRRPPPEEPPPRPQAPTQGIYVPPYEPVGPPAPPPPAPPAAEPVMVVTEQGEWIRGPVEVAPEEWTDWLRQPVELYDPIDPGVRQTVMPNDVYRDAINLTAQEFMDKYNMPPWMALHQLEDDWGYPVDWEEWRDSFPGDTP